MFSAVRLKARTRPSQSSPTTMMLASSMSRSA
jgi:hypothetical protein